MGLALHGHVAVGGGDAEHDGVVVADGGNLLCEDHGDIVAAVAVPVVGEYPLLHVRYTIAGVVVAAAEQQHDVNWKKVVEEVLDGGHVYDVPELAEDDADMGHVYDNVYAAGVVVTFCQNRQQQQIQPSPQIEKHQTKTKTNDTIPITQQPALEPTTRQRCK